ncbi:hypothetical protein LH20_22085 (plasmid) [Sphingopyxis sp. 113P3]|nr:hypothetical protein LH20_22085 [Sphingopyxis sp. 113P3]
MLTLSIAADHGVELAMMKEWLPGLRVETLLILAQRYSSWQYDGPDEHELTFYSNLAGVPSTVRSNVASLLSLNQFDARALLRFRSPSDVEALTHEQLGTARSDRPSLFNIYAAALADRIQGVCRRPLFVSLPIAQVSSRAY